MSHGAQKSRTSDSSATVRFDARADSEWSAHIRGIADGSQESLARLYDASSPLLYGIAVRMLRNREDAEEAVADVYSHVWRNASTWDPERGGPTAWLVLLCRSRCIDRIRSRASRISVEIPTAPAQLEQVPGESSALSVDTVLVKRAMEQLGPEQRLLLDLAFFSGLSHQELSEHLRMPLGTVKTRVRSAIAKMRDLLKELAP